MPQNFKRKQRRRPQSKKLKFQQKFAKWIPYMIVCFFAYTLYLTQFVHFFSQSQRDAHENHLAHENEILLIFNFSTPQDVMDLMMNLQKYFTQIMTNIDLNQMYSFLHDGFAFDGNIFNRREKTQHPTEYRFVRPENFRYDEDELTQNPHEIPISDEPLVYIFNSHQTEMIGTTFDQAHQTGDMNIIEASFMMAENFENYGITALVEERSVPNLMAEKGWTFPRSYDASRIYLEETINQFDSLKFFFDLHRDAVPRNRATVEVDGKSYARIMLVIGTDNPGQHENLRMAEEISEQLEEQVPGITRDISFQGGLGYNGIYNQDLAATLQLFEIGSYETTVEEAKNTIEVLTTVLSAHIKEQDLDAID